MYSKQMNITAENDSTRISKLLTFLGLTFPFTLIGFVTTFVYSSYFNRTSTFAESFLFRSSDSPPTAPGFVKPPPFGNHFFGDYLWIYAEIKNNGLGGYFGFSQLFLILTTKLPYYLSLTCLLVSALFLLFISARLLLHGLGLPAQLALLTSCFLFTQPALLGVDRGQIHLILFGLLILGLTLSSLDGGNRTWGVILIAAAISMKLAPVFFLLLFVRNRHWKELKISVISLVSFLILPLVYLHSGVGSWKFLLGLSEVNREQQEMYNSVEYFRETLAYNHSFKLLSYYFSEMDSVLGRTGSFIYDNYFWLAGIFSIFFVWLIVQRNVTQFEAVLLMAIASSLLIPIAGGYTLLLFISPLVVVLTDNEFVFTRINIVYCCFIGVILMPKQISLGFQLFQDSSITIGGIVNAGLSLFIVFFIAGKCFYLNHRSFNSVS